MHPASEHLIPPLYKDDWLSEGVSRNRCLIAILHLARSNTAQDNPAWRMMKKATTGTALPPVAECIAKQIDIQATLGKTQRQIAIEVGYHRPNMISMMRHGEVKVPIDKVPALARALNMDPAFLMRLTLQQYWPKSAEAIAHVFGSILTRNEVKMLEVIRSATSNSDPEVTPELECKIRTVFE
jgi:hypothetical protein